MKYYIIAGEPSGDLHGSNLMRAIQTIDTNADFSFWGGDKMLEVSGNIVQHIRETSIMGFVEVARNIFKIASFFRLAKSSIIEYNPDVIVLIDYPGFNLRLAKWAKKRGFKIAYYISPQLWAWKKGRIKSIKEYIDEMIVILPFEKEFYEENKVSVHYVGHPLVSVIDSFLTNSTRNKELDTRKVLAVLPGSRKQEISKILPVMLSTASALKDDFSVEVAIAPNLSESYYQTILGEAYKNVKFIKDGTYVLLTRADLALVASGTATLETALFEVPQVVCYKTSWINYQIGKRLVDLEFISLVNLISRKKIVPELIQDDLNENNLRSAIKFVISNSDEMITEYRALKKSLQSGKSSSMMTADVIVNLAKK